MIRVLEGDWDWDLKGVMDDKWNGVMIGVMIGALTLRWIYGFMDLWLMVYEGAFLPAGMGWDTCDGIGIGRYMIGLDGMGADIPFTTTTTPP